MKHIIATLIAVCIVSSSLFTMTTLSPALDDTQMQQLWNTVNSTSSNLALLLSQLSGLNASQITEIIGRLHDMKTSVDAIQSRLGYNSTYTIKSDFDKVLAALYTVNGTNRVEIINGNQLVLAHISENTYNKVQDVQTTSNQTKASVEENSAKISNFDISFLYIFIFIMVIIFLIVTFMIVFIRQGRGSVREYRGSNESLFMPQAQQPIPQPAETASQFPICFKKFYDVLSPDCAACSLKVQCSGMQPQRTYPVRNKKR
jgi:hypothetical protein